ncbi:MAG: hypothetical protein KC506_00420, partial [Nanoarchaeota archaeon]|nr:hypothetical protein [Nanoarchaeota archaeon]
MKKLVMSLVFLFIIFNLISVFLNVRLVSLAPEDEISENQGFVGLTILAGIPEITIHYPLNESYNYSYLQTNDYGLDLNVSSNFNPDFWYYRLYDLKHGGDNYTLDVGFVPNSSMQVIR